MYESVSSLHDSLRARSNRPSSGTVEYNTSSLPGACGVDIMPECNMRIIRFFLLTCLLTCPAFAENLVLMNGTIIDGTGKPRVIGNLRIRDGKIADIGAFRPAAGETLLDVK